MPEPHDNTQPAEPPPIPSQIRIVEPLCSVFRRKLKSEGLKYTPERAQILDAIITHDDVFQADQLMQALVDDGVRVSKATVYRTIKLLAESGIIQQVLFDAEHSHYQLAFGSRSTGVLVNNQTKEITTFDAPELLELRDRVCAEHNLEPDGIRFVVYARPK